MKGLCALCLVLFSALLQSSGVGVGAWWIRHHMDVITKLGWPFYVAAAVIGVDAVAVVLVATASQKKYFKSSQTDVPPVQLTEVQSYPSASPPPVQAGSTDMHACGPESVDGVHDASSSLPPAGKESPPSSLHDARWAMSSSPAGKDLPPCPPDYGQSAAVQLPPPYTK